MILKPKIRGFVCITAHPEGCAAHVREEIAHVRRFPPHSNGPRKALVIGGSTGYGLSSRIALAFGYGADTLSVFFERPASNDRPASAGWYNTAAFQQAAREAGIYARGVNGDAFTDEIKRQTLDQLKAELGQVDLVVYSLAAPRRTDPRTGEVYKSVLKPVGRTFTAKSVDTDRHVIQDVTIEPATPEEIAGTVKVMGGEDWEWWMEALLSEGLLAPGARTLAYSYVGPEVTWPIYKEGTIGHAKDHLDATALRLDARLREAVGGRAWVSVNKAVVTQASSAIPVVPLYISLLYRIMKSKGVHEGCIEQICRLFAERLYTGQEPKVDEKGRIRVDDLEMREDVQKAVVACWPDLNTATLNELADYQIYQSEFLKLFGFGWPGVDYARDVPVEIPLD